MLGKRGRRWESVSSLSGRGRPSTCSSPGFLGQARAAGLLAGSGTVGPRGWPLLCVPDVLLPPGLCQRPGRHPAHRASDGCPCSMRGHWRSSHHSLCSSGHHLNPTSDEAVIQQDVPSTQLLLQASQRAGDSPASGGSPQGAQTALPFPLGSPKAFMAPRVWSAAWPSEGRREVEVDLGWTTAATSGFAGHAL